MPERGYERYAWIILLALGVAAIGFGFNDIFFPEPSDPPYVQTLTGKTWDDIVAEEPGLAEVIRVMDRAVGLGLLGFGLLMVAIAAVPYRRGERWAWYASWAAPTVLLGFLAITLQGSLWLMFAILLVLALLGLLLPWRKFFPKG